DGSVPGGLAVARPPRSLAMDRQPPAPPGRHPATANRGGLGARAAGIDRRQRQQAPGLRGISRPLGQPAQSRRVVILPKANRSRHGKPPLVCHGESYPRHFVNRLRESRSTGLGISPEATPRVTLPPVKVIGTSPLTGVGIDRAKVPSNVQTLPPPTIEMQGPAGLVQDLNQHLGSISLSDNENNPYQPDVYYRGFAATSVVG